MKNARLKSAFRPAVAAAVVLLSCFHVSACGSLPGKAAVEDKVVEVFNEPPEYRPMANGPTTTHRRTMHIGGHEREYLVSTPTDVHALDGLPLIMVFHGYRMTMDQMRATTNFDSAHAVVVYMQGVNTSWAPAPYATTTGEEDLAFFDAVREQMLRDYPVNPARVFAAGHSNGGGFVAYAACHRPHHLTGIATVSAAYYEKVFEGCAPVPMKQIDFHGTADPVIDYEGGWRYHTRYEPVQRVLVEAEKRNHCHPQPIAEPFERPGQKLTWQHCDAPLEHYRLEGSRHVWPGGLIDIGPGALTSKNFATKTILDFFRIPRRN